MTNTITPEAVGAAAAELNARQVGILMTGKTDASGRGLAIGPTVTRKALQRRGLLDENMCWTELGRKVVAHIDNPPTTEQRVAAAGDRRAEQILDALAATVAAPGCKVAGDVDEHLAGILADAGLIFNGRITNRGIEHLVAQRGESAVRDAMGIGNRAESTPYAPGTVVTGRDTTSQRDVTGPIVEIVRPTWPGAWGWRYRIIETTTDRSRIIETAHPVADQPSTARPAEAPANPDPALAAEIDAVRDQLAADQRPEHTPNPVYRGDGTLGCTRCAGDVEWRPAPAPGDPNAGAHVHLPPAAEVDAELGELGLVRLAAGRYESDAGVIVEQHGDRTWWAYAPKPATSERRVLCSGQATLAATLPYVAEWLDELAEQQAADYELALRCNGVTFARIVPGGGAPGPQMTPGTTLVIDGETFPVADRSERGGIMAAHRLGEALAAAGYRIDGPDFRQASPAPLLLRIRLRDFEPVLDAHGNPVPLPEPMHAIPLDALRHMFAGRVPADCGHYMAASERRAGLHTCERCPADDVAEAEAADDAELDERHRDELVVMPGDDRKIDTAAAATCSAVLARPETHGGKVEPYLFSDGPLGDHVETLCEVHGACTTARLLTADELAKINNRAPVAGPPPSGDVVPRPRNGFSIIGHADGTTELASDDEPGDLPPTAADAELLALRAELDRLRAAVELHRPRLLDKYARPTDDPAAAKWIRCGECNESVPAEGCKTWQAAHPA